MPYRHIITNCFSDAIGGHGVTAESYERAAADGAAALIEISEKPQPEYQAILKMPGRHDDIVELAAIASRLRENCDVLLVVGTGGSSLGARTLCALRPSEHPRLQFLENVDPETIESVLGSLDPSTTGGLFVSKSGGTTETLGLSMIVLDWMLTGSESKDVSNRAVAITASGDNPLRALAQRHDIPLLSHNPDIGGRFSVFSSVGMLPAAVEGLDTDAIREGAHTVVADCLATPHSAAPVEGAALAAALASERGVSISVLMPYRDKLAALALWYRQLWAESLGKGGRGTTPVQAAGTVDQHSQLQLYLDGPPDKWISLVTCTAAQDGKIIPAALADDAGLGHLGGRTVGALLDAFSGATAQALADHGRPVRELRLDALDGRSLGAVMMHFILETLVTARLWGVDPFGQPAVESGKVLAMSRLAASKGAGT
tara:strand:- start:978 stop:2267 length:1290 start_codon:yes stop_codon:yes gene_type:complete